MRKKTVDYFCFEDIKVGELIAYLEQWDKEYTLSYVSTHIERDATAEEISEYEAWEERNRIREIEKAVARQRARRLAREFEQWRKENLVDT